MHRAHEEGFYILDGEIEFTVGAATIRVGVGGWVLAPIGVPHTFTPDRYIRYFDEMAAAINASGQPSPARVAEIMARYDTEVVGDTARR